MGIKMCIQFYHDLKCLKMTTGVDIGWKNWIIMQMVKQKERSPFIISGLAVQIPPWAPNLIKIF